MSTVTASTAPVRPSGRAIDLDNIPSALRMRPQWVCWRYVERDGKPTKCPFNTRTGGMADSTDPSTWSTFDQALATWRKDRRYEGISFVFAAVDPFCGVDLDDCIDPAGEIKPWGKRLIDLLDSYAEISPSGTGVKIFLQASKPGKRCRKTYGDGEVEIYDHGRVFAVTGRRLTEVSPDVEHRQQQLDELYYRILGHDPRPAPCASTPIVPTLEDQEVIRRAGQARNGAKFRALWFGDTSGYRSDSEADLALCGLLAFWTGPHFDRIDHLFRQSGLCDDKWLRREDYRTATLSKAIAERTQYYEPQRLSPAARIAMRAALARGNHHD